MFFRPFERVSALAVVVVVAFAAWILTAVMATDFYTALQNGTDGGWADAALMPLFLMWTVMMAAMMLPSFLPTLVAYANLLEKQNTPAAARVFAFVSGYCLVWFGFSGVAAVLQQQFAANLTVGLYIADPLWRGGLLLAAGGYQLSRFKLSCLRRCRHPLFFLLMHWKNGWRGAVRMGAKNGLWCLGCCLLLMSLLFVGGVMDLRWIGVLTLYVLAEKVIPVGQVYLTRITGVILIIAGIFCVLS